MREGPCHTLHCNITLLHITTHKTTIKLESLKCGGGGEK